MARRHGSQKVVEIFLRGDEKFLDCANAILGDDLAPEDQFRTVTLPESGLIAVCQVMLLASKDVFHRWQAHF